MVSKLDVEWYYSLWVKGSLEGIMQEFWGITLLCLNNMYVYSGTFYSFTDYMADLAF